MSRRHLAEKRKVHPDPRYGNVIVMKFINCMMVDGKKSTAERQVYGAFDLLEKKYKVDPLSAFSEAVDNIMPDIEVRSRRVGGATYQVPIEVRKPRALALALRWIIAAARKRSERTMRERLAAEFFDAFNKRGASVKRRDDTHKTAEGNRAFTHYRW